MYKGYTKIFWGILIATFNIKLGMIKILPAFIGFMIISSGISSLYSNTHIESFKKAKMFSNIIVVVTIIGEFIGLLSNEEMNLFIFNGVWIVFYSVMEILMFFKLFEGSIEYFNINNHGNLAQKNTKTMRSYIIISVINVIFLNFALIFNITSLNIIVALVLIIVRIYLMALTRGFKNIFVE